MRRSILRLRAWQLLVTLLLAGSTLGPAAAPVAGAIPLWQRFAPEVRFHHDESYYPARAQRFFIANSQLRWGVGARGLSALVADYGQIQTKRLSRSSGTQAYSRLGCDRTRRFYAWQLTRPYQSGRADCLNGNEGFFLDLRDISRHGEGARLSFNELPVYYHYRSGRWITYWFFYAYNDAAGGIADHEGDWERIVIDLNSENKPVQVAYYTHGCAPRIYPWSQVPRVTSTGVRSQTGTHPIVWAAKGSHGSWHEVGDGSRDHCNSRLGIGEDKLSNSGRRWRTWNYTIDVTGQLWRTFGGAWGDMGGSGNTTGPLGPYPGKKPPPAGW
jgi:hypothetical protein